MTTTATATTLLLDQIREDLVTHPGEVDVQRVARILRDMGHVAGARELLELTAEVRDHVHGLGPLQDLVAPGVTDILVNADGSVWVDDEAGLHATSRRIGAAEARALAVRLATAGGRRLDDASPTADAHVPDGVRLHAALPALTGGGTVLSLRLPSRRLHTLTSLADSGMLDTVGVTLLQLIVRSRLAFVVTGGTGTGKTTLLNALLGAVDPRERVIVVEDARELEPGHPHVVHLQARHANTEGAGAVDLTQLVRQCLRMRPDRIVVGECRGAEVRELLQALNTGHEGGCGTLHANTASDVPARLEALGALGGLDRMALASQAASALDVILHLDRRDGIRRLDHIALLDRTGDGALQARTAVRCAPRGAGVGSAVAGPAWDRLRERLGLSAGTARRLLEGSR